MTIDERAQKIAQEIILESRQDRYSKATVWEKHLEDVLAVELRAVREEAEARMAKSSFEFMRDENPYRAGLLRAAEIAKNTWDYIPQETWDEGFEPDYVLTQKTAAERIRKEADK